MAINDSGPGCKEQVLVRLAEEKFARVYGDLKGAKSSGENWMLACCPFHEDSKPSFGFNTQTGQWSCFSGCGKGDVFDFLMRERGLPFKEMISGLCDELGVTVPAESPTNETIYSYRAENGEILYQVIRKPNKKFVQRRPDGNGGWFWSLKGVSRVLYNLPELNARPDDPVFVVEGEKDADRLTGLGLLATTSSGGAGNWKKEYTDTLSGRDVIILPDNDAPGRDHAESVARSFNENNGTVKVLNLPDLPEKGDVSDWLNAGGSVDQLLSISADIAFFGQVREVQDLDRAVVFVK